MTKYFILHPAVFKLDGGAMFGIIPKPLWSKAMAADEQNRIQLSLRVMYLETQRRKILIDTGIGDYHGEKFDNRFGIEGKKNPLVNILEKELKVSPEEITDLIISHLHFDHVGGLGTQIPQVPLFPKATIHLHRKHYQYALNPTPRDAGSFQSQYFKNLIEIANQNGLIHWLEEDEGVILQDSDSVIRYKCSFGHTPWLVHAYDEKFIYMADLVPTSHHVPIPWVMGYDIAPGQTTQDKIQFYEFISKEKKTMIFEHDPIVWGAELEFLSGEPKIKNEFQAKSQPLEQILL